MNSQKLIIMCGLPFSGKTTYSKNLEKEGYLRISFDETWVKLEESDEKDLTWRKVRDICMENIRKALEKGSSVVFDDTNLKKEHRKEISDIADKLNVETQVVYLDISVDELRKRQKESVGERHGVDEDKIQEALGQLEKPRD